MGKAIITTFTDPMMGLSYESEPVFRKLETHFEGQIEFRCVMAGLVRDVSDFMTPEERSMEPETGIRRYCQRLAQIYKSEESIGGLPIHMDGFHLFDEEHRSSYPLCIAYEAAKLTAPEKAEAFLYRLRYATIVQTRQTTKEEELLQVAKCTGLDESAFSGRLHDGTAAAEFQEDLRYTRSLGICGLPAYLVQVGEKKALINALVGFDTFAECIRELSENRILPKKAKPDHISLENLLLAHPLISRIELCEALSAWEDEIRALLRPYLDSGSVTEENGFYRTTELFSWKKES